MKRISHSARRQWLLVLAGVAVGSTRFILQYRRAPSVEEFFTWSIVHFVGVGVFLLFGGAIILQCEEFFLGPQEDTDGRRVERVAYIICAAAFLLPVFVLLVKLFASGGSDDYDY